MSGLKDFIIENGVLTKYVGNGGNVVIPDGVTSIGNWAFSRSTNLNSIVMPNSVTSIGEYAFYSCESLTSITIPDSVTHIGAAFSFCKSLTSITIPDSVTSIGDHAFYWCQNLTSITIPDSVTNIGVSAFSFCKSLTSITIPDSVTSIGDSAFYSCESLTSITIPDSVTSIGDSAFYSCESLTTITIPDSVKSIGEATFYGCTSLTSIIIPDNVTSIGKYAFYWCQNLSSIVIPDSVTHIGSAAFGGCPALADGDGFVIIRNILYGYAGNATEIVIPDDVISIDCNALKYCVYITSITIPESVTSIGNSAFEHCRRLTSITIPNSVTSIGDSAFDNCQSLTSVTISNNLKEIGKDAFANCANLKDWKFNEEIATFEDTALEVVFNYFFSSNMKLFLLEKFLFEYSDIANNDTSVNKKIKANKKKLFDLAIEQDNAELVEKIFSLYKTIKLDELNEYIEKASETTVLKAFLLSYKEKHYSISEQEQHENDKLEKELGIKERTIQDWKKIYIFETEGDTVTITGYKGTDIDVIIPEKIGKYNVVTIGDDAFNSYAPRIKEEQETVRKEIRNIVIPNGVTSIGDAAFAGCINLETITIPESVSYIGKRAFYNCKSLSSIIIPDGVKDIFELTFNGCETLESVAIPDSVTFIGEKAFNCCKKLKSINIDFSKVEIENDAFSHCNALTDENGLFINGDRLFCVSSGIKEYSVPDGVAVLDDNTVFYNIPVNLNFEIHKISYKMLVKYGQIVSVMKLPSDLTEIRDAENYRGLCTYNDRLKEIQLPEAITKIGSLAFKKCVKLKEIYLREGITIIGNEAFAGSGLKTVTIPSTVEYISYEAFADCSNLRVVNISEGVKTIGVGAFSRCSALAEIYIPASVTEILDGALPTNKNLIIYTPAGSYAEQYAKENKRKVKQEKEEFDDNTIPFEYKISKDKTVKITAYISDNPNLVIPAQIEGCKVVGFNKGIFKNNKVITSVVWPAEIPVIPSEFFFGCSLIEKVVLSEGVTEISEKAFRNCSNLTSIHIPASVTSIHEKAFECARNTLYGWDYWTCLETIYAPEGSYAETYAYENNIQFIAEE